MTTLQEALDGAIKYINSYAFANWQPVVMALHEAKAALAQQREPEIAMIDAAMVEMANISPPLRRSECQRLIRAALSAAPAPQAQPVAQPDWLLKTTQDLAKAIARDNYPEVPQFEVLDDLAGVISQIDNMVTGMERKSAHGTREVK